MNRDTISIAFEDFLSSNALWLSLVSFIITTIISVFFIYLSVDLIGGSISYLPQGLMENISSFIEQYPFLSLVVEHEIVVGIFHILLYIGLGLVLYYIFFGLYTFVISLFNQVFIKYLRDRHYIDIQLQGMGILYTILFYLKIIVITMLIFIVLIPIYPIPVLNLSILIPFYYFFHKSIVYDISSNINNFTEYKKIKRANKIELRSKSIFMFLLTLIPVIGVILYPFYIYYIGHFIMKETEVLRDIENFKEL